LKKYQVLAHYCISVSYLFIMYSVIHLFQYFGRNVCFIALFHGVVSGSLY